MFGNDLALSPEDKLSFRFSNKVNFHLLAGYDVEKVTKEGNVVYARIKKLRIINVAEEGAISEYM